MRILAGSRDKGDRIAEQGDKVAEEMVTRRQDGFDERKGTRKELLDKEGH